VHAALLAAIRQVAQPLAQHLHDGPKFKSFTTTPLLGTDDRSPTAPGMPARFEVGLLTDTNTATVLAALTDTPTIHIGRTEYRVDGVELAGAAPYEVLAGQAEAHTEWTFDLLTPVSFATALGQGARRQHPWPDAVRVFTNLADRWDCFAPSGLVLPADARTAIEDHLETSGGNVRLVEYLVEPSRLRDQDGYRRGAVGTVTYRLAAAGALPGVALRALDALAGFACYAGMGDRTALGMGHVRLGRGARPRSSGGAVS
jgi:CRISPR-associated endoribonuclease Cas6